MHTFVTIGLCLSAPNIYFLTLTFNFYTDFKVYKNGHGLRCLVCEVTDSNKLVKVTNYSIQVKINLKVTESTSWEASTLAFEMTNSQSYLCDLNSLFASVELPGAFVWKTLEMRLSLETLRQTEMSQVSSFSATKYTYMWPWTTKPVLSRWGIFVAIHCMGQNYNFLFYAKNY